MDLRGDKIIRKQGYLSFVPLLGADSAVKGELTLLEARDGSFDNEREGFFGLPRVNYADLVRNLGHVDTSIAVLYGRIGDDEEFAPGLSYVCRVKTEAGVSEHRVLVYKLGGKLKKVTMTIGGDARRAYGASVDIGDDGHFSCAPTVAFAIHGLSVDNSFATNTHVGMKSFSVLAPNGNGQGLHPEFVSDELGSICIDAEQDGIGMWRADGILGDLVVHVGGFVSKEIAVWVCSGLIKMAHDNLYL